MQLYKRNARGNLTGKYFIVIEVLLLSSFIPYLIELPFSVLLENPSANLFQGILYIAAEILISLIAGVLTCGNYLIHMEISRGENHKISDIFYCFRNAGNHYFAGVLVRTLLFLPASVLYYYFMLFSLRDMKALQEGNFATLPLLAALLVSAAACTMIAGLLTTFFYHFLLDEEESSVGRVLLLSLRLLGRNFGRVCIFYLSFLGMEILVFLSFGVGSFWVTPYFIQSLTLFYEDIRNSQQ